jgi:hypothetical protein
MKTMEEPSAVLAIREALTGGNVSKAESQLAIIANEHGDDQLALVVKELQPGEVAAVVSVGDYTKPSIVVNFITPEQFIGALERLGASWGSVDKETTLRPMLEQVEDFICSTLLATEGVQKNELIEAFLDHDLGESIVILLCGNEAL